MNEVYLATIPTATTTATAVRWFQFPNNSVSATKKQRTLITHT